MLDSRDLLEGCGTVTHGEGWVTETSLIGEKSLVDSEDDYAALRSSLARAVSRVCPRWLSDGRDDLVQAAILRVMESRRRGTRPEMVPAYLARVAYSALVDEIRRLRRRREVPLEEEDHLPLRSPIADPEEQASRAETARGIRKCLANLLRERRLAVTLHLAGHSVREAAEILGWGFKRTENLVYRGIVDLRSCLTAKGLRP